MSVVGEHATQSGSSGWTVDDRHTRPSKRLTLVNRQLREVDREMAGGGG